MPQNINIKIELELLTTLPQFEKMMLQSIRDRFNRVLPKVAQEVEKDLQQNISRVFTKSREYESLLTGPLNAHFGLESGTEAIRLDKIIFALAREITVEFVRISVRGKTLTGGLKIKMFVGNFEKIISLGASRVLNDGESLPWLEWLLLWGDEIIIANYGIKFGSYPKSRSGEAIMVEDTSMVWRVPPGVSGTEKNNWITRAVDGSLEFIIKLTTRSINRHLDRIL
jgi:hypothetical protein